MFAYLDSRTPTFKAPTFERSSKLTLLRTCNMLLKRLSKVSSGWVDGWALVSMSGCKYLLLPPLPCRSSSGQRSLSFKSKKTCLCTSPLPPTPLTYSPHPHPQSANAMLCGRVLLFLAKLLPLTERSGVNLNGAFNVANVTPVEEVPEVRGRRWCWWW